MSCKLEKKLKDKSWEQKKFISNYFRFLSLFVPINFKWIRFVWVRDLCSFKSFIKFGLKKRMKTCLRFYLQLEVGKRTGKIYNKLDRVRTCHRPVCSSDQPFHSSDQLIHSRDNLFLFPNSFSRDNHYL